MNGILLVDKPQGWTSMDVAAKLKGLCHTGRVGHSGTLDPMATGLLVCFIGRATRAVSFSEAQKKQYVASFRPGVVTDTQDITGTVLTEQNPTFSEEQLRETLVAFTGEIEQIPPMYSAIRVNGQRLYEIARKGGEIERKARKITIRALQLLGRDDSGDYALRVDCSKGTYIRTLCHDIGAALGCGGCMSALRRTEVGAFSLREAHTMEELIEAAETGTIEQLLLPVDRLFSDYPSYTANDWENHKLRCGNAVKSGLEDGEYRVYAPDGEFLLLGKVEGGTLKTIKSFFEV